MTGQRVPAIAGARSNAVLVGLWYSAATGSTCYENRAGGGHNPIPDATPSVDARPIIVNGDYVYGTGLPYSRTSEAIVGTPA